MGHSYLKQNTREHDLSLGARGAARRGRKRGLTSLPAPRCARSLFPYRPRGASEIATQRCAEELPLRGEGERGGRLPPGSGLLRGRALLLLLPFGLVLVFFFFFPFFSPSLSSKAIKALSAALRPPIPERSAATALPGCAGGRTGGSPPLRAAHLQREKGFSLYVFFSARKSAALIRTALRSGAAGVQRKTSAAAERPPLRAPLGNKAPDRRSECCIFYSHEIKHIIFRVG